VTVQRPTCALSSTSESTRQFGKMSDRKFRSESIDKMEELFAHTDERVLMAQKVRNMCWAQIIQDVHFQHDLPGTRHGS
jgi:hypothetical protein